MSTSTMIYSLLEYNLLLPFSVYSIRFTGMTGVWEP